MQYYIACKTSRYFTAGKFYPVLDYIEGGILTADDENANHYLSADYLLENFRKASQAQIDIFKKNGGFEQ